MKASKLTLSILVTVLISLVLAGCEIAPKGDLTRVEIDRPYTLPDEVAKISLGWGFTQTSLVHAGDSITRQKESVSRSNLEFPVFENAINDDFTWVFPLGFRWQIYNDESNSFGIQAFSLLLYNYISVDYWHRISSNWSIRPFYRASSFDLIWIEERRNFGGADLLYQATPEWAFTLTGKAGKYSLRSELVEIVVRGFTNNDDFRAEVSGSFWGSQFKTLYSINDRWDVYGFVDYEFYDLGIQFQNTHLAAGANFYW